MIPDERLIFFEVFYDFAVNRLVGGENAVCIKQSDFVAEQRRSNAAYFCQDDGAACEVPWMQSVEQCCTARTAHHVYEFKRSRTE